MLGLPDWITCPNCKYEGRSKKYVPGSFLIELLLYFLMIIPGLLYTGYRHSKAYKGCPKCGYQYVIKK